MGADITECEQAKSGNCCYCKNMEYYKLQQLQLEKDNVAELNELLISYKEENEKLEQYKKSKQASYEKLQDRCNKLEWENRELKQKLEKIREICKDAIDGCNCKDVNPDIDCFDCRSGGEAELGNKILQIIGE